MGDMEKLFDVFTDAVVIVSDGIITYFNRAAANLISQMDVGAKAADFIPDDILGFESERFVGEMIISGKRTTVSVNRMKEKTVLIFYPQRHMPERERQVFTAPIVSKMNNSLSVIKMAAGLLQQYIDEQGSKHADEYVAMIMRNFYILSHTVNEVCWIAEDNCELSQNVFDLTEMMDEITRYTSDLVDDRNIEFIFRRSEKQIIIYADEGKLEYMLAQLLSNAIRNTGAGGRITLGATVSGDKVVIKISDTGKGIPTGELHSVWSRYTEPRGLDKAGDGIGGGLSIVQSIARAHGGCAVLESVDGDGTTVTVSIKYMQGHEMTMGSPTISYVDTLRQMLLRDLADVISLKKYGYKYMD